MIKQLFLYQKVYLLIVLCAVASYASAQVNSKPFVIPELKEWVGKGGALLLNENSKIVYNPNQAELSRIAKLLADDFREMFKQELKIVPGKAAKGDVELRLKSDKRLGEEGYSMDVSDHIVISAPTYIGVYWGTRTLLQIGEQSDDIQFSKGIIRDYPDYKLRGFMLDCGRKFIPMSYLHDLVKIMSYYKMNTLQVHLNDNAFKQYFEHDWNKTYAAFRLESDTYPGLEAFDGFYTKKEFIRFQKEAMKLGVEIIPEIDIPAHSLAFSQYMPELGSQKYGMDHLDLSSPKIYPFFDALLKEYLDGDEPVFCGKRVHVGTDEYSNEDPNVIEKFREFTDHYIHFVEGYGKQACVWGSLTHAKGTTQVKSENVVMSIWNNGFAEPKQMIEEGYQLICIPDVNLYIVPLASYYHDYLDLEQIYNEWTPAHIAKEVFAEKHPAILGGMFALWNDHTGNGISLKDIHWRLFPAIQTLSAKMWSGKAATLPFAEFNRTRVGICEAPGVNQLGSVGREHSLVFEKKSIPANFKTGIPEIGYNYTVSFELFGKTEVPGTVLFSSPNSVFYLADPISGLLGFARDGYLNTFRYRVRNGENATIRIEGDDRSTMLKVNDKIIDRMDIKKMYYNCGKDSMSYIRTLVFPLEESGAFHSKIEDFKVYNYIVK